jgi:hypothetical protein
MKHLLSQLALMALAAIPSISQAALVFDFRSTTNSISFGNTSDLSSATDAYSVVLHATGSTGDTTTGSITALANNWQNWFYQPGANLVSTGGAAPVANLSSFGLTLNSAAPSYAADTNVDANNLIYGYTSNAVAPGSGSGFLVYDPVANTLQFTGGGNGLLEAGGQFLEYVYIQGDWSKQISGVGIGNGFSAPQVNVFTNPSGPVTVITSFDANYDGVSSANLTFILTAVPVPSAVWLFGSAVAGFLSFSRLHAKQRAA